MKLGSWIAAGALLPALVACGSTAGSAPAGTTGSAGTPSASTTPTATSGAKSPTDVDACGLLSAADASQVATEQKLSTSASYTLAKQKMDFSSAAFPASGCTFTLAGDSGYETVFDVVVKSGDGFSIYGSTGTKVQGLGDEAYSAPGGGVVVRVGSLMLAFGQGGFDLSVEIGLFQKMIPKLS